MGPGELSDNGMCFACGQENPHGLRMMVRYQDDKALCDITLPEQFQGWREIAHGGVVSTMLDEIMAYAVLHYAKPGVTISMETKFRKAVPLGKPLQVAGWIEEQTHRAAKTKATVRLAEGGLLAESQAKFLLGK